MAHCRHCKQDIRLGGRKHRCEEGDAAMAENHQDSTTNSSELAEIFQRRVQWFVSGSRSNGTRWESTNRYSTKEQAEAEMKWCADNVADAGEMKVLREFFPSNFKSNTNQNQ